jgi:hypothetical protein
MHGYAELIEGWRDKCREVESERDALRAEVEVLRRALAFLAKQISSVHGACPADCDCDHYPDLSCKDSLSAWAISEARKDKEGEG